MTVDEHSQYAGDSSLTGSPRATEEICVREPVKLDRVLESLYDVLLAYYFLEAPWTVLPIKRPGRHFSSYVKC
jgi:hypothetical protein